VGTHFHSVLELGYYRAIGDEVEELAFHRVGKRDDEHAKDAHLEHQDGKDLD